MTNYAMICDHRDYLHQWADKIIEIIPDDIVFEEESRERIVDVLKEFEFSLNRTIYTQAKAEQREETAKEIIEMCRDEYNNYTLTGEEIEEKIKSKYGIGEK